MSDRPSSPKCNAIADRFEFEGELGRRLGGTHDGARRNSGVTASARKEHHKRLIDVDRSDAD